MKIFSYLLNTFVLLIFFESTLQATEIYSIFYKKCLSYTGLIFDVDDDEIQLLEKNGSFQVLPKKEIRSVLIFNTVENPIPRIDFPNNLKVPPRKVTVQGNPDFSFIGWPIRFFEELIVFYDINGKTHLVNLEQMKGFESVESINSSSEILLQHTPYKFGFGNNMPECQITVEKTTETVQPTRMLSDKISISKFLSVFQKGFHQLNRFQSRTHYYARPYLYERQTKIGFIMQRDDYKAEIPMGLPMNFQWSTGRNFGPQGAVTLGSSDVALLPNVEPVLAAQFSGKYHFLSLSYAANLWAFSYGSDYIIRRRAAFHDFFSTFDPQEALALPQFNQVAITGFDVGSYSVSGGLYYPIIAIQGNNIFRELLSEESKPVASIKYTTEKTEAQFILSLMRLKSSHPSETNMKLIRAEEMVREVNITKQSTDLINQLELFDLNSKYLRINYNQELFEDIHFGVSEVYFVGQYDESLSGENYQLKFDQLISSLKLKQVFEDYVSLKFNLNFFIRKYHSQAANDNNESSNTKASFAVAIEFFL